MPIPQAFEQHGEEGFRAREAEVVGALLESADGGAIALGGGSVLSRADPRGARPPHRRLAAGRRRARPGAGSPTATGRWRPAPRTSSALLATRLPLYEELADAVVPMGDRSIVAPRAAVDPGARRAARRDQAAVGRERLAASTRSWSAAGCSERRLVAAGGPPLLRLRPRRGRALRRAARAARRRRSRSSRARRAKTMAEAERVLRELAGRGMTREDHVVALGGGVVGDLAGLLRPPLPARRAGRPGADHAGRPGRLRLRRQDRRRPARGQELRRRLPPAGRGDRRHRRRWRRCRRRSSRRASSRC